jgi:hypothetical protein
MPRPTVSGTPHLILRSDSGKYAYWRNLPPAVARPVTGVIAVFLGSAAARAQRKARREGLVADWGREAREKAVERIVHPQVEKLVERATAEARRLAAQDLADPAPKLTSGDRASGRGSGPP